MTVDDGLRETSVSHVGGVSGEEQGVDTTGHGSRVMVANIVGTSLNQPFLTNFIKISLT